MSFDYCKPFQVCILYSFAAFDKFSTDYTIQYGIFTCAQKLTGGPA